MTFVSCSNCGAAFSLEGKPKEATVPCIACKTPVPVGGGPALRPLPPSAIPQVMREKPQNKPADTPKTEAPSTAPASAEKPILDEPAARPPQAEISPTLPPTDSPAPQNFPLPPVAEPIAPQAVDLPETAGLSQSPISVPSAIPAAFTPVLPGTPLPSLSEPQALPPTPLVPPAEASPKKPMLYAGLPSQAVFGHSGSDPLSQTHGGSRPPSPPSSGPSSAVVPPVSVPGSAPAEGPGTPTQLPGAPVSALDMPASASPNPPTSVGKPQIPSLRETPSAPKSTLPGTPSGVTPSVGPLFSQTVYLMGFPRLAETLPLAVSDEQGRTLLRVVTPPQKGKTSLALLTSLLAVGALLFTGYFSLDTLRGFQSLFPWVIPLYCGVAVLVASLFGGVVFVGLKPKFALDFIPGESVEPKLKIRQDPKMLFPTQHLQLTSEQGEILAIFEKKVMANLSRLDWACRDSAGHLLFRAKTEAGARGKRQGNIVLYHPADQVPLGLLDRRHPRLGRHVLDLSLDTRGVLSRPLAVALTALLDH